MMQEIWILKKTNEGTVTATSLAAEKARAWVSQLGREGYVAKLRITFSFNDYPNAPLWKSCGGAEEATVLKSNDDKGS